MERALPLPRCHTTRCALPTPAILDGSLQKHGEGYLFWVAGSGAIANPTALLLRNKTMLAVYRYSTGVVHGAGEANAVFSAAKPEGPWHPVNPDLTPLGTEDPALCAPHQNRLGHTSLELMPEPCRFLPSPTACMKCVQLRNSARVAHCLAPVQRHSRAAKWHSHYSTLRCVIASDWSISASSCTRARACMHAFTHTHVHARVWRPRTHTPPLLLA